MTESRGEFDGVDLEAFERLRQSEEMYARLFHQNPNPMAVTNLSTQRFVAANSAFLDLVGYTRAEVIGSTSEELGLWEDRARRDDVTRDLMQFGESGPHEAGCRSKSGELVASRFHFKLIETTSDTLVLSAFIPA